MASGETNRNLDPVVSQVIEAGKATLRELRECYSLEDLYMMWDVIYNAKRAQWLAHENARNAMDRRR